MAWTDAVAKVAFPVMALAVMLWLIAFSRWRTRQAIQEWKALENSLEMNQSICESCNFCRPDGSCIFKKLGDEGRYAWCPMGFFFPAPRVRKR